MEEFDIKLTASGEADVWNIVVVGRSVRDEGNTIIGHSKRADNVPYFDLMDVVDYLVTDIRFDWSKYGKA